MTLDHFEHLNTLTVVLPPQRCSTPREALLQKLLRSRSLLYRNNSLQFFIFEVKTSLGTLSKKFVVIELDSPVTLGSVTLVRVYSARVTAIWIGDLYMR